MNILSVDFQAVDVPTIDGLADGYLARPDDDQTYPGVLFYMDAFGLRPWIEEMVRFIAEQGYVVLAPNLFYRNGRAPLVELPDLTVPENRAKVFETLGEFMTALTADRVVSDIDSYLDYLTGLESTSAPLGVTGHCVGGTLSLRTAGRGGDRVGAAASFHGGRMATEAPDSPHLAAPAVRGELYLAHADHDHSMPPEQIERLDRALDDAGVTYRSEVYADAPHGFTMADSASYDEGATQRHWRELFALLDRTLKTDHTRKTA